MGDRRPRTTLVLVERAGHAPEAIRLRRLHPATVRLLALAPDVMQVFDSAGEPYAIPEEWLDPQSLMRRGRENYRRLEQLREWFDTMLGELPEPLRINPVVAHFYGLKTLFDSVSLRIEELAAVFRTERPDRIIVFTSPGDALWAAPGEYGFITRDGPIYAGVAPLVGERLGISVEVRRRRVYVRSRWKTSRMRARLSVLSGAWRWLTSRRGRRARPLLWHVGDLAHDIPDLLESLSSHFAMVRWDRFWMTVSRGWIARLLAGRPPRRFAASLEAFWSAHRAALSEQPVFLAAEINYFSLVASSWHHLLVVGQWEASQVDLVARRLIRHRRPQAVLNVSSSRYQEAVLSLALRAEGVPVVSTQEGGLYGYCHCDMYHYRELSLYDYFLAYGPGASAYLNQTRLTSRQQARAVAAGSLRLQRLRASAHAGRMPVRRVMYIPASDFHHCLWYAPLNYSDRRYFQIKQQILEVLLALPGLQLLYKPAPHTWAHDSIRPFLTRRAKGVLVNERPLTQVLDEADAFVVDWPTTSLLEVLTTRKPVAVLLDRHVTQPLEPAVALLRRRARVSLDVPSFLQELRRGFAASVTAEDLDDTAFLEAYGTGGQTAWDRQRLTAFFESLGHGREAQLEEVAHEPCLAADLQSSACPS